MRVLIGGYYGFGNLGDEALLAGLLSTLQAHGHRATVLSHDPERTAREHGVPARHRVRGLPAALLGCDLFLSGGGGLLQDRSSARSLRYYLGCIRLARMLGRRVIVFGQSIGPLSPSGELRVAATLRGLPVSVRDTASQALLARLGIDAHLGADAALLLPCPQREAPPPEAAVLLIPRSGHRWITEALAEAAHILGNDGIRCAALPLHRAQDHGEIEILQRAAPGMERVEAADYREALAQIAAARYLLSGRLHGLILAAVCDRPYAGLNYDPKVAGFVHDSGAPVFGPPGPTNGAATSGAALAALASAAAPASGGAEMRARARTAASWLEAAMVS